MLTEDEKMCLRGNSELVTLCAKFETAFRNFHGPSVEDFERGEKINKRLCDILVSNFNCSPVLAMSFIKTRLQMRLRDFNLPIRNATLNCTNKSYLKFYTKR
jgi:hypothetical protein